MRKPTEPAPAPLQLDGQALTPADVESVSRGARRVAVGPGALQRMAASRAVVESAASDSRPVYGINTGFGSLSRRRIAPDELRQLQLNLIRSHAAGAGSPLPRDIVRGTMLLLAASLARGRSGVRPVLAERICGVLNAGVTPVVPEIGSVGASGDLAPLAHIALVLVGEGEAYLGDHAAPRPGAGALASAGIGPVALEAKEGLALINGTHLMAARGALVCHDFDGLFHAALLACAMSIDACRATDRFLDPRACEARNQAGPREVAAALRGMLSGSRIIASHRENDPRVQDPYSLRCAGIVLGAALEAARYVKLAVAAELGAATDNPLVFADAPGADAIISAGNFHGMPLAMPLDTLAIALCHIAAISERRVFFMLSATDAEAHLPAFLSPRPGVNSGLMVAQYTAAACVNEMMGLANPASIANIPTSAGMEDYNSMGPRSAAKAARALDLAARVVAIELLCGAEALEHHRPLASGEAVEGVHAAIRSVVPKLSEDRPPSPDIEAVARLIGERAFGPPGPICS